MAENCLPVLNLRFANLSKAEAEEKIARTKEYFYLTSISFVNCEVGTLAWVPAFKVLKILNLSKNHIDETALKYLETLNSLRVIFLDNNRLSRVEGLICLRSLQKLRGVTLYGNLFSKPYFAEVLELIPQLGFCDFIDRSGALCSVHQVMADETLIPD